MSDVYALRTLSRVALVMGIDIRVDCGDGEGGIETIENAGAESVVPFGLNLDAFLARLTSWTTVLEHVRRGALGSSVGARDGSDAVHSGASDHQEPGSGSPRRP